MLPTLFVRLAAILGVVAVALGCLAVVLLARPIYVGLIGVVGGARVILGVVATASAVALLAVIGLLYRATRRLRRLGGAMALFEYTDFSTPVRLTDDLTGDRDEIGRMGARFERLAARVAQQAESTERAGET